MRMVANLCSEQIGPDPGIRYNAAMAKHDFDLDSRARKFLNILATFEEEASRMSRPELVLNGSSSDLMSALLGFLFVHHYGLPLKTRFEDLLKEIDALERKRASFIKVLQQRTRDASWLPGTHILSSFALDVFVVCDGNLTCLSDEVSNPRACSC